MERKFHRPMVHELVTHPKPHWSLRSRSVKRIARDAKEERETTPPRSSASQPEQGAAR